MKVKSLVIVNEDVTVKINQILHTPPITLEKLVARDRGVGPLVPFGTQVGPLSRNAPLVI